MATGSDVFAKRPEEINGSSVKLLQGLSPVWGELVSCYPRTSCTRYEIRNGLAFSAAKTLDWEESSAQNKALVRPQAHKSMHGVPLCS